MYSFHYILLYAPPYTFLFPPDTGMATSVIEPSNNSTFIPTVANEPEVGVLIGIIR